MKKEIISRFREKPKTKTAWWAMGLGLATFFIPTFLGIFAAVIRPIIDTASSENFGVVIGFGAGIFALILAISSLVMGICAFKKGERSWVLWVGFVPSILVAAFWIFMIVGEFVFPH